MKVFLPPYDVHFTFTCHGVCAQLESAKIAACSDVPSLQAPNTGRSFRMNLKCESFRYEIYVHTCHERAGLVQLQLVSRKGGAGAAAAG